MAKTISRMSRKAEEALDLGADLVEFRVDFLDESELKRLNDLIPAFANISIVTLRDSDEDGHFVGQIGNKLKVLKEASGSGAEYIDLEFKHVRFSKELRDGKAKLILSWHDLEYTPPNNHLRRKIASMLKSSDLAKIVSKANDVEDSLRILELYSDFPANRLLAFAIGKYGVLSRVISPLLGSPFVYACLPGEPAAEGQLSVNSLRCLYDRMVIK
ncbi:MAG: type I 3-dehydroquinate dehydratase [Candidatus Bathyarchaeia archaeon]